MTAARPTTYVIRVAGHLDDHWTSLLVGITVARDADGTSVLICPVDDQAQLHGVLAGLRDIGATLLELRPAAACDARVAPRSASTASGRPALDGQRGSTQVPRRHP